MMKTEQKNKKGQAESIIIFFILIVAIFVVSIVVLRLVNEIVSPFSAQIGNVSTTAGSAVVYAQNKFTGIWDTAIVLIFLVNIIILLVSSFLIDVHPAFVIIYIIAIIFMFIFGNYALYALDALWEGMARPLEVSQSQMQIFLIDNFQLIMLGIVVLSGILMYAKFKFFGSGVGTGGNY